MSNVSKTYSSSSGLDAKFPHLTPFCLISIKSLNILNNLYCTAHAKPISQAQIWHGYILLSTVSTLFFTHYSPVSHSLPRLQFHNPCKYLSLSPNCTLCTVSTLYLLILPQLYVSLPKPYTQPNENQLKPLSNQFHHN